MVAATLPPNSLWQAQMSDLHSDTVIALPSAGSSVLACGAWLKNTVCVTRGNEAHVSQLIGDLGSAEARQMLDASVARLCEKLDVQPEIVAHDLHPDFYSTQFAQNYAAQRGLPVIAVQHHHAHIAALCAEYHVTEPVLGLALDGVGLGTDNTPWGGELLCVEGAGFERLGHLAPLHLPGGDRAAREPWRIAAAVLFQLGRGAEIAQRFPNQPGAQTIAAMLQRNLNCPATSSTGRLFDAAAGLLGVNEIQSFEAQAAIQLQELAQRHGQVAPLEEGWRIDEKGVLDFSPLLAVLADCHDKERGAALFHATLAAGLAELTVRAASQNGIVDVALGGGCFFNDILLNDLSGRLAAQGLRVLTARRMSPGDTAISLGQAWVALQSLHKGN
ncbi:MAG: carbamoyltransferase HypF [Gallionellaceae bacterium]|nr:carbamoyltransferase HypF [Gallionellaceae bacterium]